MQDGSRSEPGAGRWPGRPEAAGAAAAVAAPGPVPGPPPGPVPAPPPVNGSWSVRALWFAAGVVFVILGFIGALLPVMPTVPFLILAAACFSRSSRRLESWLLDHPNFGPSLRDWRARRAIPRRAKFLALAGSSLGYTVMLVVGQPGWPLALAAAAVIAGGLAYVFTRPS